MLENPFLLMLIFMGFPTFIIAGYVGNNIFGWNGHKNSMRNIARAQGLLPPEFNDDNSNSRIRSGQFIAIVCWVFMLMFLPVFFYLPTVNNVSYITDTLSALMVLGILSSISGLFLWRSMG